MQKRFRSIAAIVEFVRVVSGKEGGTLIAPQLYTHGCPWVPMGTHGYQWVRAVVSREPSGSPPHTSPLVPMGTHG